MEIIKSSKNKLAICEKCTCIFQYEQQEAIKLKGQLIGFEIKCPECNERVLLYSGNKALLEYLGYKDSSDWDMIHK